MAQVEQALSGVLIFVAAARAGSFTLAGERLGITKSAVGKSIAKLEERLGCKLFHRTRLMSQVNVWLVTVGEGGSLPLPSTPPQMIGSEMTVSACHWN